MANCGETLKQPIKFLSRHLWGLITVNLFVFSGLVAIGSLAAYLFRQLDTESNILFLRQLGFYDDVGRVFFPAVVMFFLWLGSIRVAGLLRLRRINVPPFSSVMYFLFMLSLVLGFV